MGNVFIEFRSVPESQPKALCEYAESEPGRRALVHGGAALSRVGDASDLPRADASDKSVALESLARFGKVTGDQVFKCLFHLFLHAAHELYRILVRLHLADSTRLLVVLYGSVVIRAAPPYDP